MKTLYLARHAKSSWDAAGIADFDRPLNKRGRRDAPEMGGRLAEMEVGLDLMVASPARRAAETAAILAEKIGYPAEKICFEPGIYEASPQKLLELARNLPAEVETAMLLGHNPGMTELAEAFSGEDIDNLPTAAVIALDFQVDDWTALAPGHGVKRFLAYPKQEWD